MPDKPWKPGRRERRVLLALLSSASNLSGYPLSKAAQVRSGRVYIILGRLERSGWVAGQFEDRNDGKPHRRYYRLTPEGRQGALAALGLADRRGGRPWLNSAPR